MHKAILSGFGCVLLPTLMLPHLINGLEEKDAPTVTTEDYWLDITILKPFILQSQKNGIILKMREDRKTILFAQQKKRIGSVHNARHTGNLDSRDTALGYHYGKCREAA